MTTVTSLAAYARTKAALPASATRPDWTGVSRARKIAAARTMRETARFISRNILHDLMQRARLADMVHADDGLPCAACEEKFEFFRNPLAEVRS